MQEIITVELPYPPSTNRYWRTFRGRTVASKEATEYKKLVQEIVGEMELCVDDVAVTIQLKPRMTCKGEASKVCIDLDNSLKVLFDALQGAVILDDKQIKSIRADYGQPVKDGGVIVTILKIKQ